MTTKNGIPTLESLLGAEKVASLKAEVQVITNETYQPLLNSFAKRLTFSHTTATVTSEVELELVEEDGKPVVTNNVSLGIKFSPERPYDAFEQTNRLLLSELFARTLQK